MKVSYTWLKEYVGDALPAPQEVVDLLTFHAFEIEGIEEVVGDTVIEVDVLPNRSSDCLCHRGIAREIATLVDAPLAYDPLREASTLPHTDRIQVSIEDADACPRFTASLITGVTVGESPEWLKTRLRAIGQRPINNIVDATNYVMFALGQPLHAYDADRFPQQNGVWDFGVRYAREGEVVSLIAEGGKDEERDVVLTGSELLIVDRSNDTPVGLAGVKGGRFAGVHEDTKNVIIEAAHFNPSLTRKTARGLGIVIDASKRFENEPSRELPPYAQAAITRLITDIAGGASEGMVDAYLVPAVQTSVAVDLAHVNALLGLSLTIEEMRTILERTGTTVAIANDMLMVTGPWERTDLTIEEDFIEEIGRVYGYDHVASVVPEAAALTELNARHYYSERIREALITHGFSEVITSSFRKKDEVKLRNALASDKGCLRSSLTKNLSEVLDKNISFTDLLGTDAVRVFEIGTVFHKNDGRIAEHVAVGLGVRTRQNGYNPKDDVAVTEALTALEATLGVALTVDTKNGVAEFDLTQILAELPVPTSYEQFSANDVQYRPFSSYPHMSRDIALWVPEGVVAADVLQVLNEHAGSLRVRTTLFDEFHKDGRTSLAFRLVFQSYEKTLTDEEVNGIMESVYAAVAEQGWEVR